MQHINLNIRATGNYKALSNELIIHEIMPFFQTDIGLEDKFLAIDKNS